MSGLDWPLPLLTNRQFGSIDVTLSGLRFAKAADQSAL